MDFQHLLSNIEQIREKKLLGKVSHNKVMDLKVRDQIFKEVHTDVPPRKSAVLVLLYPDTSGKTRLVLILRKSYNGHHSGQIAFPGGKYEDKDRNLQETALRETWEEIGVESNSINVLRPLTSVFIPVSNYWVQPFLAYTHKTPVFIKDDVEVDRILEFSLSEILKAPLTVLQKTYFDKDYTLYCFQLEKYKIWGATAMILSEVVDLLQ